MHTDSSFSDRSSEVQQYDAALAALTLSERSLISGTSTAKISQLLEAPDGTTPDASIIPVDHARTTRLNPNDLSMCDDSAFRHVSGVIGTEQEFLVSLDDTSFQVLTRVPNHALQPRGKATRATFNDVIEQMVVVGFIEQNLYRNEVELQTPDDLVRFATQVQAQKAADTALLAHGNMRIEADKTARAPRKTLFRNPLRS